MAMSGNGGTLDDCHTNMFALTELNNLRWRCYFHSGTTSIGPTNLHSDPVIKAYGACLKDKLLCTWRRQPAPLNPQPEPIPLPLFLPVCTKELWVFWFSNEEPPNLGEHTDGLQNTDSENGPGNATECGIRYEVRHMFFKALHTLLTNKFVHDGCVRFGRWFTKPLRQPLPGREHLLPRFSVGYQIKLLVAGGNTVCATILTQKQPTLFKITKKHLELKAKFGVLLAPWSLRATFIGADLSFLRVESEAEWEAWKQFFLPYWDDDCEEALREDGVPSMVAVEADGVPLVYPSCLVGVTWEEDPLRQSSSVRDSEQDPLTDLCLPYPMEQTELRASDGGDRNRILNSEGKIWEPLQTAFDEAYLGKKKMHATFTMSLANNADDERCCMTDPQRQSDCVCEECRARAVGTLTDNTSASFEGLEENRARYEVSRRRRMLIKELTHLERRQYDLKEVEAKLIKEEANEDEPKLCDRTLLKGGRRETTYARDQATRCGMMSRYGTTTSSSSEGEEELDQATDDNGKPPWARTDTEGVDTGIYCSADDAVYRAEPTSPGNSSDDDHKGEKWCMPLSPHRCISPCNRKLCSKPNPFKRLDAYTEDVLKAYLHPPRGSEDDGNLTFEQKAEKFDCFYNINLKEDDTVVGDQIFRPDLHRSWRRKRLWKVVDGVRVPPCPQDFKVPTSPGSPEPPGSQETIPATSSPPPSESRIADLSLRLEKQGNTFPPSKRMDVEARGPVRCNPKRNRHPKGRMSYPQLDELDVSHVAAEGKEDLNCRLSNPSYPRLLTDSGDESASEQDTVGRSRREPIAAGQGEGTSGAGVDGASWQFNPSVSGYPTDEMMDVDEGIVATQMGAGPHAGPDVLSPPASNERVDHFVTSAGWHRGPPSVGTEAQMNNIYPTPPSVLVDTQQCSPQTSSTPTASTSTSSGQIQIDASSSSSSEFMMDKQALPDRTRKEEKWEDDEIEAETYPELNEASEMTILVDFLSQDSLLDVKRNLPFNPFRQTGRFAVETIEKARRKGVVRPLDYEKLKQRRQKSSRRDDSWTERVAQALQSRAMLQLSLQQQQQPSTSNQLTHMRFPGQMVTPGPHQHQQRPMQPHPSQMNMGYGNMGHPVQQLNNMVNNQMYGGPAGGHPVQGMPGHMGPMGQQMGYPPNMTPGPMGPMGHMSHPGHMGQMGSGPGMGPMGHPGQMPQMGPGGHQMVPPGGHMGQMGPSGGVGMPQGHGGMTHMGMQPNPNMYYRGGHPGGGYGGPMDPSMMGGGHGVGGVYGANTPNTSYGNPMHMHQPHPSHGHPQYGAPPAMHPPQPQTMLPPAQFIASPMPAPLVPPTTLPRPESSQEVAVLPSLPLALLLSDTILDLHYDSIFDACPICSCNTSIKARELGLYITPPEPLRQPSQVQNSQISQWSGFYHQGDSPNTCNCGFSAVRYRYLSMCSGLFPDDAKEATGDILSVASIEGGDPDGTDLLKDLWYNSNDRNSMNVIDIIRRMAQGMYRDMGGLIGKANTLKDKIDKTIKPQTVKTLEDAQRCEYVISNIDRTELLLTWSAAMDLLVPRVHRGQQDAVLQYFHPWGLQVAKDMYETSEYEWRALLGEVKPLLEESIKTMRNVTSPANIIEGPLTWRNLAIKCIKSSQDEEPGGAEPIPTVLLAGEREAPLRASPYVTRFWENLSLGPVDQPKDVFYVAITLDSDELGPKTKAYVEEISRLYEQMRLGRHIPITRENSKDGILRLSTMNVLGQCSVSQFLHLAHRQGAIDDLDARRVQGYCAQLEMQLGQLLQSGDGSLFERNTFREAGALETRNKIYKVQPFAQLTPKQQLRERQQLEERNKLFRENNLPDLCEGEVVQTEREVRIKREPGLEDNADLDANLQELMSMPDVPANGQQQMVHQPQHLNIQLGQSMNMAHRQPLMGGMQGGPSLGPHTMQGFQAQPAQMQQQHVDQKPVTHLDRALPGILPGQVPPDLPPLEPEQIPEDEHGALPHVIVVYLVNPFLWAGRGLSIRTARVISHALLRAFNSASLRVVEKYRAQLQLEIIGAPQIFDHYSSYVEVGRPFYEGVDQISSYDAMRDMCFSVYSTSRNLLSECVRGVLPKSMTRFGPASHLSETVDDWEKHAGALPIYKVANNPWHLAPPALLQKSDGPMMTLTNEQQVLYVTYCLLGSDWLCASITDSLGRISDNCLINMRLRNPENRVPKYRFRTQILDAMQKLWMYILGSISVETKSWRIVIGKLGRIGHGEFRAWASLLSKSNLRKHTQRMQAGCPCCTRVPSSCPLQGCPVILSACLVSLEPEPNLRVFPSFFSHSENQSKGRNRQLSTPEDASCTHIIVFPTSADIQLGASDQRDGEHMDDDDLNLDFGDTGDFGNDLEGMNDIINDPSIFGGDAGGQAPPMTAGLRSAHGNFFDTPAEVSIENQPLATGFYVSTAPAPDLPEWFWTSCPSARKHSPVHLKSSLHINVPLVQQGDEGFYQKNEGDKKADADMAHPLDSNRTDEVLRHVLETYNALSWLNIDFVSGERRSCLPVHMQALLRLYHSVARLTC